MEGIINVLKPPGMTSHDVVSFLRRTLGEKKIGHCGTLDPQAAGVLPVCLGQATKLASYLSGGKKSYYCEMALGYETDTQDIWGEITQTFPRSSQRAQNDPEAIREAFRSQTGEIWQEAPAYSSVKKDGKSLHRYAREGKPVTGITRKVRIDSIDLIGFGGDKIRFIVYCGSGTYVRTLCRDIGRKLDTGGAMSFLLRLSVGPCLLEDSVTLEEIQDRASAGEKLPDGILLPKELALSALPCLQAGRGEAIALRQGQVVWLRAEAPQRVNPVQADPQVWTGRMIWVADDDRRLVALGFGEPGQSGREGQFLFKPDKTFV